MYSLGARGTGNLGRYPVSHSPLVHDPALAASPEALDCPLPCLMASGSAPPVLVTPSFVNLWSFLHGFGVSFKAKRSSNGISLGGVWPNWISRHDEELEFPKGAATDCCNMDPSGFGSKCPFPHIVGNLVPENLVIDWVMEHHSRCRLCLRLEGTAHLGLIYLQYELILHRRLPDRFSQPTPI